MTPSVPSGSGGRARSPLESVSRALCKAAILSGGGATEPLKRVGLEWVDMTWPNFIDDARAAITALMEPSEEMVNATMRNEDGGILPRACRAAIWRAMISKALE